LIEVNKRRVSSVMLVLLIGMFSLALNRTYGQPRLEEAYCVVETGDGGYALAGSTLSTSNGAHDAWLIKTDADGNVEWSGTYGGADTDATYSIVQTGDGGYALAGITESFGVGGGDSWLVKVDSSGKMEWNKTYGGTAYDEVQSVVDTSDGGYALAGSTTSFGAGGSDYWLVKVDASGNIEWSKAYGGRNEEWAQCVVETKDSGFALAGSAEPFGAGDQDFRLVKVDASGNMEWNKTYGGADSDIGNSVVETSDGGYALAGDTASFGAGGEDFWLIKTDAEGNMQWNRTYGGANDDTAFSLVQTSDGGYALGGDTLSVGAGSYDAWLIKTDSDGNAQWNKTYGGRNFDGVHALIQTSDWGYALAGSTAPYGMEPDHDFWFVKVDSAGNMEWNKAYGDAPESGWLTLYVVLAAAILIIAVVTVAYVRRKRLQFFRR
jgi:predicted secreted protein